MFFILFHAKNFKPNAYIIFLVLLHYPVDNSKTVNKRNSEKPILKYQLSVILNNKICNVLIKEEEKKNLYTYFLYIIFLNCLT